MQHRTNVVVANGGTDSSVIDLHGMTILAVVLPAGFDGVSLEFEATIDEENLMHDGADTRAWYPVYDFDGNAYSAVVAAERFVSVNPEVFKGAFGVRLIVAAQGQDTLIGVVVAATDS